MKANWKWQDWAACSGEDLVLFFGLPAEREPQKATREKAAKAICAQCPVRRDCLDYALSVPEKYGTWGGLTEYERGQERRRRMRRGELQLRQPVSPREKQCPICEQVKSIDEFGKDQHTSDGLNRRCRKCVTEAWRRARAAKQAVAS